MSSTTNVAASISTITSPMSAIFTPPPSCSSHWTYEDASANSLVGGIMMQEAQWDRPDTPCFPSGFEGWGRAPSFIQVFSPGACPAGYTTANNNFNGEVTTGVCCPRYSIPFYTELLWTLLIVLQQLRLHNLYKWRERRQQNCRVLRMHQHVQWRK